MTRPYKPLVNPDVSSPAATAQQDVPDGSAFDRLVARLRSGERQLDLGGVSGAARGQLVRQLIRRSLGPVVTVAADEEAADLLERDLRFFLAATNEPGDAPTVLRLPTDEVLPYDEFSPDRALELARLRTLFLLSQRGFGKRPCALVLSVRALSRRLLPRRLVDNRAELLGKGGELDRDALARRLAALGYAHVPLVEDPGTFAVRGGIVDVFSPIYDKPARLELFGDEVESLRLFDPETQRTLVDLPELYVSPAREVLFDEATTQAAIAAAREAGDRVNLPSKKLRELTDQIQQGNHVFGVDALFPGFYGGKLSTILDYLPPDPLFLLDDPSAIEREAGELQDRLQDEFAAAQKRGELALPPEEHFTRGLGLLEGRRQLRMLRFAPRSPSERGGVAATPVPPGQFIQLPYGDTASLRQAILEHHGEEGALTPLVTRLSTWRDAGLAGVVACHAAGQVERLKRLLLDRRVQVKLHAGAFAEAKEPLYDPSTHVHLFVGEVSHGFVDAEAGLAMVSDEEIFGARRPQVTRNRNSSDQPFVAAFRELKEGDLIVHVDFGIGRYDGLVEDAGPRHRR